MEIIDNAERALIGALLLEPKKAATLLLDGMDAERISAGLNRNAYTRAIRLFGEHGYVDETTLAYAVSQDYDGPQNPETTESCKAFFLECKKAFGSIEALPGIIKMVNDSYKSSAFTAICSNFVYGSTFRTDEIDTLLERTANDLGALMLDNRHGGLVEVRDITVEQYSRLFDKQSLQGNVRTGLTKLDSITRQFRKKQLIVVAARPKVGKSALILNWSVAFAKQGKRVALFSLEMGKDELYERYMAHMAGVNYGVIQDRDFGDATAVKISQASAAFSKLPILLNDDASQTVDQMRMEAKLKNADVVIVDYLQLIRSTGRHSNRDAEVGSITRALKRMAMELDIPVIVISQLNRQKDETVEPSAMQLRESGSIEQDANMILMLWDAGIKPEGREKYVACKVEMNRSGPTGELVLRFMGALMTFTETDKKVDRSKKSNAASRPWKKALDAEFVDVPDQQVF
jgi:replicative DNA helicase